MSARAKESAEEGGGVVVPALRYQLELTRRIGKGHPTDVLTAQGHHDPVLPGMGGVGGINPESGGQHPVVSGRSPAALDVPQHGRARLHAAELREAVGHALSDAAEAHRIGAVVHHARHHLLAAAKAGVDALTLGLAEEVADQGIRVVGVAPGVVNTGIHADAGEPARPDRIAPTVPMRRAGEPEEIAAAVAWLMSDEASYVTGTTLRVAGGR